MGPRTLAKGSNKSTSRDGRLKVFSTLLRSVNVGQPVKRKRLDPYEPGKGGLELRDEHEVIKQLGKIRKGCDGSWWNKA